jgi:hypothetical protein
MALRAMVVDHPPRITGIAGHFGWLAQVNWGHGMIGKASVVTVAAVAVLGIVATRVPSEWAMLAMALVTVCVLFGFLFFMSNFARKYPELAATEGLTYVQSRQIDLAAKGMLPPSGAPIIPDPQNPTLLGRGSTPNG